VTSAEPNDASPPLEDLRILELGEALAGPLTCTLMADFGADVLKVERPGVGDSMRRMGPQVDGAGLWWAVTGRGKRSVVDMHEPEGRDIVHSLATRWADVVVENFRPGVIERLGLGWEELHRANRRLILVRISGFGQTGPYSERRGFGKIAEAFSGATNLTGHRGEAPVQPGYSLGDACTATFGVIGTLLALQARARTGEGQLVDLALYEGLLRLIEWQFPLVAHTDIAVTRNGNLFPFEDAFITDIVPCHDGRSVVYSAATTTHLDRLAAFLADTIGEAPRSSTAELVGAVRQWASKLSAAEVVDALASASLVAGQVMIPEDLLNDPHIRARENVVSLLDPVLGDVVMPGIVPKLSMTPGRVKRGAPALGADTWNVLTETLEFSAEAAMSLVERGVVATADEPRGARADG
jgi:crotonobetainyl-CoA:carnitine CoA-transferase CaiB-like acyl-CoA transferase